LHHETASRNSGNTVMVVMI